MQRFNDRRGIVRRDLQEREGRPLRHAPALLPVAKCGHTDTNHQCKLGLRLPEIRTDRFDIGRLELPSARGLPFTAANRPRLAHALQQFVECVGFHLNSSRTTRASVRSCVAVRSPCSFFAYR